MSQQHVKCDGFAFHFSDAIHAFKFDESDRTMPNYHGAPMKKVDVVAELESAYIFVEIKDYADQDPDTFDPRLIGSEEETAERRKKMKWLKNYLKYKYRDSFLFRHAEGKSDKPIHYICVLTFDNAFNNFFSKQLRLELPIGKANRRWTTHLAESCHVINIDTWNRNYPKWPLSRVEEQ